MVEFADFNEIVGLSRLRAQERGFEEEAADLLRRAAETD
jgi:hypothetical protein